MELEEELVIEKLNYKKTIRDLKDYVKDNNCMLADAIEVALNHLTKQEKIIQKLEARKYMLNAETGEITQILIDNNYINKNKIKEKIEELKFLLYSFEKKQEEKLEYVDKGSMNSILAQISILNAVLEE